MKKTLPVKSLTIRGLLGLSVFLAACGISTVGLAQTRTIRVVTYNIEDDINGATTPLPGLIAPSSGGSVTNGGVLEGIGEEVLASGTNRPIDILTLQETTSNTTTVQPIVNGLNAFYGSRTNPAGYAMSPYQATDDGGETDGGGPNAMVYNTNTLQLIASVGIGTPNSSSEPRQIVRYEFAPCGRQPYEQQRVLRLRGPLQIGIGCQRRIGPQCRSPDRPGGRGDVTEQCASSVHR